MKRFLERMGFGPSPYKEEKPIDPVARRIESGPERGDERLARALETPPDDVQDDDSEATNELPADPAETDTTEDI
jgi:hypothetical protein